MADMWVSYLSTSLFGPTLVCPKLLTINSSQRASNIMIVALR